MFEMESCIYYLENSEFESFILDRYIINNSIQIEYEFSTTSIYEESSHFLQPCHMIECSEYAVNKRNQNKSPKSIAFTLVSLQNSACSFKDQEFTNT